MLPLMLKGLRALLDECVEKGAISDVDKFRILEVASKQPIKIRDISVDVIITVTTIASFILLLSLNQNGSYMLVISIAALILSIIFDKYLDGQLISPDIIRAFVSGATVNSLLVALGSQSERTSWLLVTLASLFSLLYSHKHKFSVFLAFLLSVNIFYVFAHSISVALIKFELEFFFGPLVASILTLAISTFKYNEGLSSHVQLISICTLVVSATILIASKIDSDIVSVSLWFLITLSGIAMRKYLLRLHVKYSMAIIIWGVIGLIAQTIASAIELELTKIFIITILMLIGLSCVILYKKTSKANRD
jgi:hypothetical protein